MPLGNVLETLWKPLGVKTMLLKKSRRSFRVEFEMGTKWLNRYFKKLMETHIIIAIINFPDIAGI